MYGGLALYTLPTNRICHHYSVYLICIASMQIWCDLNRDFLIGIVSFVKSMLHCLFWAAQNRCLPPLVSRLQPVEHSPPASRRRANKLQTPPSSPVSFTPHFLQLEPNEAKIVSTTSCTIRPNLLYDTGMAVSDTAAAFVRQPSLSGDVVVEGKAWRQRKMW